MNVSGSVSTNGLLLLLLLLLPLHLILCSSGAEVVTVDVHKAKGLIQTGHVYLDVRTVEEFQKGHADVGKIINIPYMLDTPMGKVKSPDFLKQVATACNKEDHLVVGCLSGVRSMSATVDLLANGFKNVNNMGGGYTDWVKNKFPVKALVTNEEL